MNERIKQPEQQPVAWLTEAAWGADVSLEKPDFGKAEWKAPIPKVTALYFVPQPAREWVGLTTEQKIDIWEEYSRLTHSIIPTPEALFKVVEALLKEKNT